MIGGRGSCRRPALVQVDEELDGRVDGDDEQQRRDEQHHAGEAVQEALPRRVAEVVGDERKGDDANDVGGERDGDDEDGERGVASPGFVPGEVQVEQAERFEREQGVQAGAGVGDEQLVLPQVEDDAGAGDGVAEGEEDVFGGPGDAGFHGQGERIDDRAGQRDHEGEEEDGEPAGLEGGGAALDEEQRGQDEEQRAELEDDDVLRAAEDVEQQAEGEERPADGAARCHGGVLDGVAQAPEEVEGDGEDDGPVHLLFAGPQGAREVDDGGDVHRHQPEEDRHPFDAAAGRVAGGKIQFRSQVAW